MALQKTNLNINFAGGIDTKSDPKQVNPGKFVSVSNSVFTKAGVLQKRNGYGFLPALPDTTSTYLTTFNGNLTAVGTSLEALSGGTNQWGSKGSIQPLSLETLPLIRSSTNQSQADAAVAPNGLVCTVFTDNVAAGAVYKYAIADSVTGQNVAAPAVIPVTSGVVTGSARVFVLGSYFIIVFNNVFGAVNHLQYVAISTITPTVAPTANANISSLFTPSTRVNFDGYVANNILYLAWNGSDGGGAIRMTYFLANLTQGPTVVFAGRVATVMSVTADITQSTPVVWASFYDSASDTGYTLAVNQSLTTILAPTQVIAASGTLTANITAAAQGMTVTIFYELISAYSFDSGYACNRVMKRTCTQAGVLGTAAVINRGVGLASKAFLYSGTIYLLEVYSTVYQPTYFLSDSSGHTIAKVAYSNGSGYYALGLPSVTVLDGLAYVSYLIKDLITAINKSQGNTSPSAVYSQTGINLVSFQIGTSDIVSSEIGGNLNLTGGFLWSYDGYSPVEQGFHLWPDMDPNYLGSGSSKAFTFSAAGGNITTQKYFYIATYEWADNQGNVFRSAPSIPAPVEAVDLTGSTNTITINVPTLRLTYKTANPIKIVLYRWSAGQQTYYAVKSPAVAPTLNDPTVDSVAIVDTLADPAIIGNPILYTTGGVIENIGPPACDATTLFDNRLWLIDSEDKNLLWYSKQVIEATPVEMSDLLTIFVAPTTGSQGSTGPMRALGAMDDKLVVFKDDAIYYINGTGPDNTGANSQYSQATFITSTVGSANQQSIVFMPKGLMFQSDKGIWLLGRDLSTTYVGAPVEAFNSSIVVSALCIPGTNIVLFDLDTGQTLMYDYFYDQWGTFTGAKSISSTLYQAKKTFINSYGLVFQETPGIYLDGSNPVLMSFVTGWLNLAGLQGYQRAYYFYLLANYFTAHKLFIQIAYDYAESPSQGMVISPDNFTGSFGSDTLYGGSPAYGGSSTLEQWRVFFQQGKCQAFQIYLNEIYDATHGPNSGAGFSLSGLNLVYGTKLGYPKLSPNKSIG